MDEQKRCRLCGTLKPISLFHTNNTHADGHRGECKDCTARYKSEYYAKNPRSNPVSVSTKLCQVCFETKPASEFHRDPGLADGLKQSCKSCLCANDRLLSRQRSKVGTLAYESRKQTQAYKTSRALSKAKYAAKYPERVRANNLVRSRVFRGLLKRQPCESCSSLKSEAHHDDYSKPLEVRWLCRKCHAKISRLYP